MVWIWAWVGTALALIVATISTVGAFSFIVSYAHTGKKLGAILWGTLCILSLTGLGAGIAALIFFSSINAQ